MARKKRKSREENIQNTIKSILLSDREINGKNLKYSIFREILLSDKCDEIMHKKTIQMRNLIINYKDLIDNDEQLQTAKYYFNIVEEIRINRVNKIVESGKINDITVNKIRNNTRNAEIEEEWKDRGYTHIKLYNGTIEAKIEDATQLNYQLKLLEIETINNIITNEIILDKKDIDKWLKEIKEYSLRVYNKKPIVSRNVIELGCDENKLERCFLYYCLSDGKLHIVMRKKYLK